MVFLTEGTSIYTCLLKEHVLHLASRSSPFISVSKPLHCLSQWPSSLKRGSEAAQLLGLRTRIKTVGWMSASCECYVCCQVGVPTTGWSLFQRSPTKRGVFECDFEASKMRRSWALRTIESWKKELHSMPYKSIIYTSLIKLFVKFICLYIYIWSNLEKLIVLSTLGVYGFR
jgi:hypothetical protein